MEIVGIADLAQAAAGSDPKPALAVFLKTEHVVIAKGTAIPGHMFKNRKRSVSGIKIIQPPSTCTDPQIAVFRRMNGIYNIMAQRPGVFRFVLDRKSTRLNSSH